MKNKPKVLYIDIENSRMIIEFPTYSLYDNNKIDPKYIKHDWYITCAAWGFLDLEKQKLEKVDAVSTLDFPARFKKNFRDDIEVVKRLHKVLQDVDLIVGHNSDAFDIKKINYKFIKHGLEPVDLPPTVDTLKAAKKYAKSSSNSLFYLAKEFGVDMKMELPKGVMWDADAGNEAALRKLKAYNKQDIKSGAALYFKLLPYIKNHPDVRMITNQISTPSEGRETRSCGTCGSSNVHKNGSLVTKIGRYIRYRCRDCGSSTKGPKHD